MLKKRLSYRESAVLGRALNVEEARQFQQMARRISAILLMGPKLDANYRAIAAEAFPWPRPGKINPETIPLW